MCDINGSNPLLLGDLSVNSQDLNDHNYMYNDTCDPDSLIQESTNYYNEEEFNTFSGSLFNEGYIFFLIFSFKFVFFLFLLPILNDNCCVFC